MSKEIRLTSNLLMDHGENIEKVFQRAVNHALWVHKRMGNPIATWKDGKVVIIPPEEIFVEEPEKQSEQS
jgi:hypothetical protein